MSREMTSFVLRFVREVSEEQEARWRGLIQHVQSGAERNFATFADAMRFMQGRLIESSMQTLEKGEQMSGDNPFGDLAGEMTKMWGEFGPQMVEMWTQAAEQMMGQSLAFRSQIDQAVAGTLKAWGLPTGADQDAMLSALSRLSDQIDQLTARVATLEKELEAGHTAPKRRRTAKRTTSESTE